LFDGLKDGAYVYDSQIVRVAAQRYNVLESYSLDDLGPEVVEQLGRGTGDFVSIFVTRLR
jgi:hypothetical protein